MAIDHILALLVIERDKLNAAIEALQGPTTTEKTPVSEPEELPLPVEQEPEPPGLAAPAAPAKRKMSEAGRQAIIAATKKRWAAIRAAKTAAETPAPAPPAPVATPKAARAKTSPVKKAGLTAAGRKSLSIAMKKRWAVKRKAAAKRKGA